MLRRFATALAVAASALVSVGMAAPAHASNAGSFIQQINADRARAGRPALAARADLAGIALRHSQRMAAENSLHHNANLTSQVANWQAVGENVGMGGSVGVLHAAFMNSPMHRANILDRDYTEIGLGVTVDGRGVMWVTEVFRRPMRATVTAVRSLAPKPSSAAKVPAASRRSTITRPPVTTRRTVRPARRSAWLSRLSSAAAANSARPAGALPKAVDYLHTVAG